MHSLLDGQQPWWVSICLCVGVVKNKLKMSRVASALLWSASGIVSVGRLIRAFIWNSTRVLNAAIQKNPYEWHFYSYVYVLSTRDIKGASRSNASDKFWLTKYVVRIKELRMLTLINSINGANYFNWQGILNKPVHHNSALSTARLIWNSQFMLNWFNNYPVSDRAFFSLCCSMKIVYDVRVICISFTLNKL